MKLRKINYMGGLEVELTGNLRIEEKTVGSVYIYDNDGFIAEGICKRKVEEIVDKVNNSIQLKNIDLIGIRKQEQADKVCEEEKEFFIALMNKDTENAKEEFWDIVQAHLGLIFLDLGITAEELMEYYPKHLEKLKNRPRKKE